jgi:hypothetical protein
MKRRDVEAEWRIDGKGEMWRGDYYYYYGESQLPGVSAMPWPARDGNGDCEDDDDDGE